MLGEVSIPERALLDGLVFEGAIRAVLLVENLGAWRAGLAGSVVAGGVTGGYSALGTGLTGAAAVANAVHTGALAALSGTAVTGAVAQIESGTGGGVDEDDDDS